MNKKGSIVIIEDDVDDQMLFIEAFKKIKCSNEIIFFSDGEQALQFLTNGDKYPFLILSDVNLPKLNGFQLREKLKENAYIHLNCTPYLFFTTASNHEAVIKAYSTSIQGFFIKPNTFPKLIEQLNSIVEYWKHCSSPSKFLS